MRHEPEVHLIGQIVGGSGFSTDNAFCRFEIKHGENWSIVGGDCSGQTQVDYPEVRYIFYIHIYYIYRVACARM